MSLPLLPVQDLDLGKDVDCPPEYSTRAVRLTRAAGQAGTSWLFVGNRFIIVTKGNDPGGDDWCACGDLPEKPIRQILYFKNHVLFLFNDGTGYGILARQQAFRDDSPTVDAGPYESIQVQDFLKASTCGYDKCTANSTLYKPAEILPLTARYLAMTQGRSARNIERYLLPDELLARQPVAILHIKDYEVEHTAWYPILYPLVPVAVALDVVLSPAYVGFVVFACVTECDFMRGCL
ncbi:MAG: hypothetical protein JNM27_18075 [Leptospirales bacterium]|nr:hypothetical protein [Leptospirales bacterium]